MKKTVIIGGGPAGMLAASTAAARGVKVVLAEKNGRLGKKLYITGKGRCNLTNDSDPEVHIQNAASNPSFLYSALYAFGSDRTMSMFEEMGVKLKVERGGRVFPASDKSSDIVSAMERLVRKSGAEVLLGLKALRLLSSSGRISGVRTSAGLIKADSVIIAAGGMAYPLTGSNGDGYKLARQAGHEMAEPYPALAPLCVKEAWVGDLEGLSLKNAAIAITSGGRKVYSDFGEMLFTDRGVSGPIILSASCFIHGVANPSLAIDLKPALDELELDKRIVRDFSSFSNRNYSNSLEMLLPRKMIPVIIELSGIDPLKKVHEITVKERRRLVRLLKGLELNVIGTGGFNESIITGGGVKVEGINPSTMESKIVQGLYFAGEVIDVNSLTGGYNLQVAFSTGYLAGMNC
ncbi:MAG: NAD(P)/FAD-dependent oxidoreductase [Clostridiales bacterium]|nr:NAD(P)/FAD-dependent oxidoreductase [Clostridiales bacterium]